jgi:hypothetical protein
MENAVVWTIAATVLFTALPAAVVLWLWATQSRRRRP